MTIEEISIPKVFVVRADVGGRYAQAFYEHGYVGIGWFHDIDLMPYYEKGKDAIRTLYEEREPNASMMRIAMNTGQIW